MKNLILSFLFFLIISSLCAQDGYYYLTHYEMNNEFCDIKINSMVFDETSTLFLASRKGVAVFDGTNWRQVKDIPTNVLVLKSDSAHHVVYAGMKDEFGVITKDKYGRYCYEALNERKENSGTYNQIVLNDDFVFFYSNKTIYRVNRTNIKDISLLENVGINEYLGIFVRRASKEVDGEIKKTGTVYVNVKGKGVCKYENGNLSLIPDGSKFKDCRILFYTTFNAYNIIFGTDENKLYLFGKKGIQQFSKNTEVRSFLEENILKDGLDFSQGYFVLSTLTGGCVFIDKELGKITYHINYMSGLPDDEINSIAIDRNNCLWISHDEGLSSMDADLKIRDYSPYPGIYGNVNDVILKGKNLYVASDNGIYMLKELTDVKEKEVIVKEKAKYGYKFVPKITYITQSVGYKFMQIGGIKDKCKQFFEFEEKVLAVSDFALYSITDSLAVPLVSDVFIHALWSDRDSSALYAATLKGILLLTYSVDPISRKETWVKRDLFKNLTEPVYSIVCDDSGNLIFGTDGEAWFAEKDSLFDFKEPVKLKFPVSLNENIQVRSEKGKIFFTQSGGIFKFDPEHRKIIYDDSNEQGKRNLSYIFGNDVTFLSSMNEFRSLSSDTKLPNQQFWDLFPKIRKFVVDSVGNTWLINGKKEIIKISADTSDQSREDFKLFFSSIRDKSDSLYTFDHPVIKYKNNAIRAELSAPFYLQAQNTMYRYKVKGLQNSEEWTKWSRDPHIELSFLPAGKYTLIVQAKNILGQLSNEATLSFTILKPFWQTNTFYYITGGGILLLIILIFWLRQIRLKRKNRILEEKVRERTIELQNEKDKTEELLLNILPKETAEELKLNNKVIPQNYDTVTVLFTDFKGFTMVAEKMTPEELVYEIDHCFREFDKIIGKYKIEKIKTIGDSYMCAAGLPKKYKENAVEAVKAALEIRDFMQDYKLKCESENKQGFEIRIGLHSGKVVAGVVGIKKYAYDIWGDTVNLASRMESSGEPGKVNVSGETYELIKDFFSCTYRGKIEAKNKGEVDMYFVDGVKEISGIKEKKKK